MGAELQLSSDEFDALDILASQEGKPLNFERLYKLVWDDTEDESELEAARKHLNNLLQQVREHGEGFMWIEHEPKNGYTFKTRWGHNWSSKKQTSDMDLLMSQQKIDDLFTRIKKLTPTEVIIFRYMAITRKADGCSRRSINTVPSTFTKPIRFWSLTH